MTLLPASVVSCLITPTNLLSASVYVAFRHSHPDKETVEEVKEVMQDNNIDVSRFVESKAEHCQQAKSLDDVDSSEQRK